MGRKGVSKRKKAKQKSAPAPGSISSLTERKLESLPEKVTEKSKGSSKDKKKKR